MVKAGVNDVLEQLRDEHQEKNKYDEWATIAIRVFMVVSILWTILLTILALAIQSDRGNFFKVMIAGLLWVSKTINFAIVSLVPKRKSEFVKNCIHSDSPSANVQRRKKWIGFFLIYKSLVTGVIFVACITGTVQGESPGLLIFILVTYALFYILVSVATCVGVSLVRKSQSTTDSA